MIKNIIAIITLLFASLTFAAVNPCPGYIITNANDTINGTIDYKVNTKMISSCDFMADGTTSYRTYIPGEITGFRLMDGGKFFVSKTIIDDGKSATYFMEYLVKGEISLYLLDKEHKESYFFENAVTGEMFEYIPSSMRNITEENKKEKIKSLAPMFAMFRKSYTASNSIKLEPMEREDLVKMVKAYSNEVCGPDTPCIQYEYDKKTDDQPYKFKVFAGAKFYTLYDDDDDSDEWNTTCPYIGFGIDAYQQRVAKGLLYQFEATLALLNDSRLNDEKSFLLDIYFGPAYEFQTKSKFKPFVRLGVNSDLKIVGSPYFFFGLYGGVGFRYKLHKGAILFGADYAKVFHLPSIGDNASSINLSVGYQF